MKVSSIVLLLIFASYSNANAQSKTVKGVVTYFFNKYQGDKADIGAKIYAVDSVSFLTGFKTIDSLKTADLYRHLQESAEHRLDSYESLIKKTKGKKKYAVEHEDYLKRYSDASGDLLKWKAKLLDLNAAEKPKFDELDRRAFGALLSATRESNPNTTADGSGNYELKLEPGAYYIVIVSNNRKGNSLTELSGKVEIKKIDFTKREIIEVSKKFDL